MTSSSEKWQPACLGDHVDLITGFPFKSKNFSEDLADVKLLRGDNIAQGFLRWNGVKRWDADEYDTLKEYHLDIDDVILAMDRPWITAGLKYAWVKNEDLPALLVQRVARLRGVNGLETNYCRFLVGSPAFTDHVLSITTGVNVPHISARDIKNFKFLLPPPPIQKRIISILKPYDDLIENNTRRIAILEEMARRFFDEWFVKFRFPGHEDVEFTDTEIGSVPSKWKLSRLDEAIFFNPRTKVPKEGEKLFVPMSALSENSMVISGLELKAGNSGAKFQNGDTLVARITPCLENGKTGFVNFLPPEQPTACGSTEYIVLRSNTLCPEYVYCLARSRHFREIAIKSMSGASGRQRVQPESLHELLIAQPDEKTLATFSAMMSKNFRLIRVLTEKNENLRAQRDLLLPKLISGEIDVSQAESQGEEQ